MGVHPAGTVTNRYRIAAILLLAAACVTAPAARRELPFWGVLKPGRYDVGFRSAENLSVWYPAASGGDPLRYRDYVRRIDALQATLREQQVSDQTIAGLFDARAYARRDAQSLHKPFPMVFIVQAGGQSDADHAVLAEFLASHGYIVATIPSAAVTKAKPDFSFLRSIGTPDRKVGDAEWLHNVDFSTLALASAAFPELVRSTKSTPRQAAGMAAKMLQFIDDHFDR